MHRLRHLVHGAAMKALLTAFVMACAPPNPGGDTDRIRPWSEDPRYWQYKGKPVLLLGGSDQDNLFNHPNVAPDGLQSHLDLLASVGGNYVRNTMSSRDRADDKLLYFNDDNLYPFHRDETSGLYDLERFNDAYWGRFRDFLRMTTERDIIVQIEVFDRFDFAADRAPHYPGLGWSAQPFNPKNNTNYTAEESGLPERIDTHPGQRENPFFRTTPRQEDNPLVLRHQEAFVDKMLSISLEYRNVLYCVSNETNESDHWSGYWVQYIRDRAADAGVGVEVTEMWDPHDLTHPMHRHTFDHPELYSYVDISQNNHQPGQTHWDNMQAARRHVADPPRPINSVKIYGGSQHGGGTAEGTHRLWRNILGGLASSRFHRPGAQPGYYGIGLNELARTHLRSARMFAEAFDVFAAEPTLDLLRDRGENEAYLAATRGEQYGVFFPDGGSVELDLSHTEGTFRLRWLNILESEWSGESQVRAGRPVRLTPPAGGEWAAVLVRALLEAGHSFVVSVEGNDDNPGTLQDPWRSLARAVREAGPGDTVFVRRGTYEAPVFLTRSGEPGRPIVFRNFPGETPLITGRGESRFGIVLDGVRLVHVRGFEVREIRTPHPRAPEVLHEQGAILLRESSDCVVEGNRIVPGGLPDYTEEDPGASGIQLWSRDPEKGCHRNLIRGNRISRAGYAVHVRGPAQYNVFEGNSWRENQEMRAHSDGIKFESIDFNLNHPRGKVQSYRELADDSWASHAPRYNVIRYNIAEENSDDGIDAWVGVFNLIEYNLCARSGAGPKQGGGNGFKLGPGGHNWIRYNLAWENRDKGFTENAGMNNVYENNLALGPRTDGGEGVILLETEEEWERHPLRASISERIRGFHEHLWRSVAASPPRDVVRRGDRIAWEPASPASDGDGEIAVCYLILDGDRWVGITTATSFEIPPSLGGGSEGGNHGESFAVVAVGGSYSDNRSAPEKAARK
jgi:hypothetical protein